jgi:hypothetical protein
MNRRSFITTTGLAIPVAAFIPFSFKRKVDYDFVVNEILLRIPDKNPAIIQFLNTKGTISFITYWKTNNYAFFDGINIEGKCPDRWNGAVADVIFSLEDFLKRPKLV